MIEKFFAGITLLVCAALLLRMVLPPARQARWDAFWRRRWHALQQLGPTLRGWWWRARSGRDARRAAADAIERARRGKPTATRDGNVIRPSSFRRDDDRKPPLH
jgi:hypothetical protein